MFLTLEQAPQYDLEVSFLNSGLKQNGACEVMDIDKVDLEQLFEMIDLDCSGSIAVEETQGLDS